MKLKLLKTENSNTLLVFAIGEFILIIMGILIALQIDNWNENRKARKSELKYLHALQEEFSNNLAELDRVMKRNKSNADLAFELSKFTGQHDPILTTREFDSLLMFVNSEVQYRPGSGVLDEIISSGKLELISSDQLRYEIASWESVMQSVRFQEMEHYNIRYNLLEIVNTKGNTRMAVLNGFGELYEISQSKFQRNNIMFLKSLEFDNQLIAFIITARFLNDSYYSKLEDKIKNVLSIIKEELS